MKWTIALMAVLGLAAAVCAAVLAAVLFHPPPAARRTLTPASVTVLMAAKPLPAMAVIQARDVASQTVALDQAPPDYLSSSVQVVGRVLVMPMVAGEAFAPQLFASQGVGANLAAAIPFKKRAVGVAITNYAALKGMLYPGCAVDILLTLTPPQPAGSSGATLPVAMTILQNVEVLAIDDSTVDSPPPSAGSRIAGGSSGDRRVILLVNPRQAQMLKLAAHSGTLSLAMRNPLDTHHAVVRTTTFSALSPDHYLLDLYRPKPPMPLASSALRAPLNAAPTVMPAKPPPPQWKVQVLQGAQSQTASFPLSEAQP